MELILIKTLQTVFCLGLNGNSCKLPKFDAFCLWIVEM